MKLKHNPIIQKNGRNEDTNSSRRQLPSRQKGHLPAEKSHPSRQKICTETDNKQQTTTDGWRENEGRVNDLMNGAFDQQV